MMNPIQTTGVAPIPLQGLCEVPGAEGPLQLFVGLIVGLIAVAALLRFGGGLISGIIGGVKGNVSLKVAIGVLVIGLFIAVQFDEIVPWLTQQIGGGGLGDAGLSCMFGG